MNDFRKALDLDENFQRAKEGLETAQKRQKQASKRDYYKILGLKRNCKKKDVAKAYRKLAQKWHPDNFQDETEKKKAEKKFMDIAAAKEVLSDPEKRQKFDHGEDPLDPEDQQRANNPFHGGGQQFHFQGNPFGGGFPGGGNFRFHFNWTKGITSLQISSISGLTTIFICYVSTPIIIFNYSCKFKAEQLSLTHWKTVIIYLGSAFQVSKFNNLIKSLSYQFQRSRNPM